MVNVLASYIPLLNSKSTFTWLRVDGRGQDTKCIRNFLTTTYNLDDKKVGTFKGGRRLVD